MNRMRKLWMAAVLVISLLAGFSVLANTIYFPQIEKHPTNTPTVTLTATPTATATQTKTPTPTRTPTPKPGVDVIDIVFKPSINALDEYVLIENSGDYDVDMDGWWIKEERDGYRYNFPDDFTLDEDRTVRVWTKSGDDTSRDLYWDRATPVWRDNYDCAYLRSENGDVVDKYCYED